MRFRLILLAILLVFSVLAIRVSQLAINKNEFYENLAKQNASKSSAILPVRALITDRNGELLAVNELGFNIKISPHLKKDKLDQIASSLAECFNEDKDKIIKTYKRHNSFYNQDPIEVIDFIPYKNTLGCFFSINKDESVMLDASIKRLYPHGALASHIIGYVGKANSTDMIDSEATKLIKKVGKTGIERFYNERLQGEVGERVFLVDSKGHELKQLSSKSAINPSPLALSIDIRMQRFLDELFKDKAGAAVIMNVHNGEILAAGSYPEYDLNMFVRGISKAKWQELSNDVNHPFTNKLINGKYPPGSIVKMGVGMSFLATGKLNAASTFTCTGSFSFGGRKFRCHNVWGHGVMNIYSAIRSSCDDYFYKGALKTGIEAMSATLARLGFGYKTGVDLPLESPAILPNPTYKLNRWHKPWFQGETLNTSIGQGEFLVTPMQVVTYTAALATGKQIKPRFALESPAVIKTTLNANELNALPIVRAGMEAVANDIKGTAFKATQGVGVKIAAKTGTAQVVGISQSDRARMKEEHMDYLSRSHAWINAYAPASNPEYAIAIIIEHGMHGGSSAGPLLKQIVNKLIELNYIKKEN